MGGTRVLIEEIWKPTPGYEGYYEVSGLGRVRSLDRISRNRYGEYIRKGKLLTPNRTADGYLEVGIWDGETSRNKSIHRLVAMTFISNPLNSLEVNHKDGNKENNTIDNLEWATHRENMDHCYRTGLRERRPHAAILHNMKSVRCIETGVIFDCAKACGESFGIDSMVVLSSCNNQTKNPRCGYHFEYVK